MRNRIALTHLTATGLASLAALAVTASQAQTHVEKGGGDETIVVTRPTQDRARTYTVTQPAQGDGNRTVIVRGSASQDRNAVKTQEIRIERKVVDGTEEIQLWINGKKIDVQSMEDVQKAIEQAGAEVDVDVKFFGPAHGTVRPFEFNPEDMKIHVERHLPRLDAFEVVTPRLDGIGPALFSQPKSMLGAHLDVISDDLRDYLGLSTGAGVRLRTIVDDTPASQAGLKAGDIVVALKVGAETHEGVSVDQFREIISQSEPGTEVALTILRKGETHLVNVTLAEWEEGRLGSVSIPRLQPPMQGEWQQLEIEPHLFRSLGEKHMIELQPRLRDIQREAESVIRRAMPDRDEMFRMMEQQMQEMQRLLDSLREQQENLRRELKPSATADA